MPTATEARIAALLQEAERAHGVYERDALGSVYDEDWPAWYAAWLLESGLGDLLPGAFDAEAIAARLRQLDADFRREEPAEPWPVFYAARLTAE